MYEKYNPFKTGFYGDNTRWFIGKVVEWQGDPLELGRVKIRILGLHDNVSEEFKLPWASVLLPTTEGGVTIGSGPMLEEDAQVFGFFADGSLSQVPIVIGIIPYGAGGDVNGQYGQANYYSTANPYSGNPGDPAVITAPPGQPISPSVATQTSYDFFRSQGNNGSGWSDAQARGIVGVIMVESDNFREDVVNLVGNDDFNLRDGRLVAIEGKSYGICQWRESRMNGENGLIAFASRRGLNPRNLETQLAFVNWELDNTETSAKQALQQCKTPGQAAVEFSRRYERCAREEGWSQYPDPAYSAKGSRAKRVKDEDTRIGNAINLQFAPAGAAVDAPDPRQAGPQ